MEQILKIAVNILDIVSKILLSPAVNELRAAISSDHASKFLPSREREDEPFLSFCWICLLHPLNHSNLYNMSEAFVCSQRYFISLWVFRINSPSLFRGRFANLRVVSSWKSRLSSPRCTPMRLDFRPCRTVRNGNRRITVCRCSFVTRALAALSPGDAGRGRPAGILLVGRRDLRALLL